MLFDIRGDSCTCAKSITAELIQHQGGAEHTYRRTGGILAHYHVRNLTDLD
jgi:hypothetical protein